MVELIPLLMFGVICLVLLAGFPVAFSLAGTALIFAGVGIATNTFESAFLGAIPNRLYGDMTNMTLPDDKFDNPSFPEGSLNAPPLKLKLMLMIGTDLSSTNQKLIPLSDFISSKSRELTFFARKMIRKKKCKINFNFSSLL